MRKLVYLLFSTYFVAGMLVLQKSDLFIPHDLPDIYGHCKALENLEITPLDFITDQLLDLDNIFDLNNCNDPQKPHQTPQVNHETCNDIFLVTEISLVFHKPMLPEQNISVRSTDFNPDGFIGNIFHPPIFS